MDHISIIKSPQIVLVSLYKFGSLRFLVLERLGHGKYGLSIGPIQSKLLGKA